MNILSLKLIEFRNYHFFEMYPKEGKNIIIGENGVGKTNLIEAISYLITGKSFRTSKDKELINFDSNVAVLEAKVEIEGYTYDYKVLLTDKVKSFYVNEKNIKSLKDLNKLGSKVVFTPESLLMVKSGPGTRRDYIDSSLEEISYMYSHYSQNYRNILYSRNTLLKRRKGREFKDLINIYNRELAKYGSGILKMRLKYIRDLEKIGRENYREVFSNDKELKMNYLSTVEIFKDAEKMEKSFIEALKNSEERDLNFGYTTVGPHRDDLEFYINGENLKVFGSQGQIRSLVLALKIAECEIIKNVKGYYPLLLLDDVFSELDEKRRKYLFSKLKDIQSFITTTDFDMEREGNFIMITGEDNGK